MNVTDFISEELIFTSLAADDKESLIGVMVDRVIEAGRLGADRRAPLVEKLLEREALSTTGIGGGVAIPHASGEAIESMMVAVGQIPDGIDYDALDGAPVKLVFMIIGSERSPRTHLQLLARLVRICKNRPLLTQLEEADSAAVAMGLIAETDRG